MSTAQTSERKALQAVWEALDIPYAATVGGDEVRAEILNHRIQYLMAVLKGILDGSYDIEWSIGYLRERLAEYPPVGYVTYDQALRALARGLSWSEAVAASADEEASGGGPR